MSAAKMTTKQHILALTILMLLGIGGTMVYAQGYYPEDYEVPRTADGYPDLQGLWTNETITPMERPDELGDKAYFTPEEMRAMEERVVQGRIEADDNIVVEAGGIVGGYNLVWYDWGDTVLSTGQTSIITDPPTGKAPIRSEAETIRDHFAASVEDHYIYNTVWDRCITRGVPGSMLPAPYNNAYRFIQTKDSFHIYHEMIHDMRTISLDKDHHIDSRIKLWMGDSIGYWEGDTLVVETRNYNNKGMIASSGSGGRLKGVPITEDLHVVERFTRVSDDTILWEARISDPEVYTEAFTVSMPLTRNDDYVMYEYACHEGNYAVRNVLRGGREKEAAARASQ